jgi:hypothetical protein
MAGDSSGVSIGDIFALLTVVVVALVLIGSVMVSMRPKAKLSARQYDAELFKRRMLLDELTFPIIHDVRLSDPRGYVLKVDQVVRLPDSVVLVCSAPTAVVGAVKVHPTAGSWRYVTANGKVGMLTNPVVTLHPLIHAIRQRFPLVRVRMLTVFPRTADLGESPPKCACQTETLLTTLKEMAAEDGPPSQAMDLAWEQLSQTLAEASAGTGRRAGEPGTAG